MERRTGSLFESPGVIHSLIRFKAFADKPLRCFGSPHSSPRLEFPIGEKSTTGLIIEER